MYKDIIRYQLAEGIRKDHLIYIAKQIVNDWKKSNRVLLNVKLMKIRIEV